jgi:hypothetical protein
MCPVDDVGDGIEVLVCGLPDHEGGCLHERKIQGVTTA